MRALEGVRERLAEKAGLMTEKNALIEVRVNFAKEVLFPKVARFTKELSEIIKPIPSTITKGLSADLAWLLEGNTSNGPVEHYSSVLNLGGINLKFDEKNPTNTSIGIHFGYRPEESCICMYVATAEGLQYDGFHNVFDLARLTYQKEAPFPKIRLSDKAEMGGTAYKLRNNDKEISVLRTNIVWPLMTGDAFYNYISDCLIYIQDTVLEICTHG